MFHPEETYPPHYLLQQITTSALQQTPVQSGYAAKTAEKETILYCEACLRKKEYRT
jgi:hypothetical protein